MSQFSPSVSTERQRTRLTDAALALLDQAHRDIVVAMTDEDANRAVVLERALKAIDAAGIALSISKDVAAVTHKGHLRAVAGQ
jgi:hypothetical protein